MSKAPKMPWWMSRRTAGSYATCDDCISNINHHIDAKADKLSSMLRFD